MKCEWNIKVASTGWMWSYQWRHLIWNTDIIFGTKQNNAIKWMYTYWNAYSDIVLLVKYFLSLLYM